MPGPAPPLPAGPPPQAAYAQQDQQAAHAAAWAAYYQSQGATAGAAYSAAAAQPAAGPAQPPGAGANPYANYGYGAAAQHAHSGLQPQQSHGAGPSQPYRPPQPQAPVYPVAPAQPAPAYGVQAQQQQYNPQAAGAYAGYQAPTQQGYQQQYGQQAQQGYNWGQQNQQHHQQHQPQPAAQPYRPSQPQTQPYNSNQPYFPQAQQPSAQHSPYNPGQNTPYRPPSTPAPMAQQHRPYQPQPMQQNRLPSGPRPPMNAAPQGGFPPAKRPRFDGPGGGGTGVGQPMGMQNSLPRPPTGPMNHAGAVRPFSPGIGVGIHAVQPGFNNVIRPPSAPAAGIGRNIVPPVARPPIHLGMGGPPPALGFPRNAVPMRGVVAPAIRGRGGIPNAPRGPAGMRRPDVRPSDRKKEEERAKESARKKRDKEREEKTTMTDWRIVGIEMKELGWSWGLVSGQEQEAVEAVALVKEEAAAGNGTKDEQEEGQKSSGEADSEAKKENGHTAQVEIKVEPAEGVGEEAVEENRGEKRKAETPEVDGGECFSLLCPLLLAERDCFPLCHSEDGPSKRRPSDFILTHGKPNDLSPAPPSSPSKQSGGGGPSTAHDSNSNRFRIYFESPAELDRIPKALRRNPNKRWRRESSSVAPSRFGDAEEIKREATEAMEDVPEAEEVADDNTAGTVEVAGTAAQTESASVTGAGDVQEQASAAPPSDNPQSAETVDQSVEADVNPTDFGPAEVLPTSSETVPEAPTASFPPVTDEVGASVESAADPETSTADAEIEVVGDISMATDPGTIAAAISELVDTATVDSALAGATLPPSTDSAEDVVPVMFSDAEVTTDTAPEPNDAEPATTEGDQASETQPVVKVISDADILAHIEAVTQRASTGPSASNLGVSIPDDRQERELSGAESAVEQEAALVKSAENAASAYRTRIRRRSSMSSVDSGDGGSVGGAHGMPLPSTNRVSILYEDSSRRLCFDAVVVERVRVFRDEGRIEIRLLPIKAEDEEEKEAGDGKAESEEKPDTNKPLAAGVLVEVYDPADQRFISVSREKLDEMWSDTESATSRSIPPVHRYFPASRSSEALTIAVYLNKVRPLSEPKWCRNNGADEWLIEQFGGKKAASGEGWKGKLEIMDPDPAPTLQSILDAWCASSHISTSSLRKEFTQSLLSDPNDLLEILLRLTRGERNPPAGPTSSPQNSATGALAPAVRSESPYASHQTHVSLAILAMYRLTTDYAAKAGEKKELLEEKIGDIIKSLPVGMIGRSLDGMYKEWEGGKRG